LSDIGLSDVWHIGYAEMTFRLVLALALGGLIGFEREWGGHPAGFRTHILVCLGSAVVMLLSEYGFSQFAAEPNVQMDPARLAAQVISGIGFLGAGTILRTGFTISGLTTAASLWVVAAISALTSKLLRWPVLDVAATIGMTTISSLSTRSMTSRSSILRPALSVKSYIRSSRETMESAGFRSRGVNVRITSAIEPSTTSSGMEVRASG